MVNLLQRHTLCCIKRTSIECRFSNVEYFIITDPEGDEPDAAIFSKSDLTINGNGSLSVDANYNDGIKSKDELIILSGTITVDSVDDGIIGKDSISLQGGTVVVNAGGDGLKSTNDEDTSKGYIAIDAGVLKITSGSDAIQAETSVTITNGEFNLYAGGGSSAMLSDAEASAKGIKASVSITVENGFITIDSADDALNSNQSIVVNGGTFVISSGDDGFHADSTLTVNGGEIDITKSYEGIESAVITINDGDIHIVSSDDGLNVAGGNDNSGDIVRPFGDVSLSIAGEAIPGSVDQTVTGGFLLAVGSSGMTQAPGTSSTQYSVLINLNSAKSAGTLFNIQSASGASLLTFAPSKAYQSILFSSPGLTAGGSYKLYFGGGSTGTLSDGLYEGGTYTPGTQYTSFTISDITTTVR